MPPFSKMRGVELAINELKSKGVTVIGYVETSVSMAGWGVAEYCKMAGLKAVIFDPQYVTATNHYHSIHREKWRNAGARIEPIPAGMAKVNWYVCRKKMAEMFPGEKWMLLPLGVPFQHTIDQTAIEISIHTPVPYRTLVTCVGSGTICAGLLKGVPSDTHVIGVMSRTGNVEKKRKVVMDKCGVLNGGLFGVLPSFTLVDPGWEYTEESEVECPFPCHPCYDLKAWEWLMGHRAELKRPVLFWNIGAPPYHTS